MRTGCVPSADPSAQRDAVGFGRQERQRGAVRRPVDVERSALGRLVDGRRVDPGRDGAGCAADARLRDGEDVDGVARRRRRDGRDPGPVGRPGREAVADPRLAIGHDRSAIGVHRGQPSGRVDDRETMGDRRGRDRGRDGHRFDRDLATAGDPRQEHHRGDQQEHDRDRRDATDAARLPDRQRTRIVEVGWVDHGPATIRDMGLSRR